MNFKDITDFFKKNWIIILIVIVITIAVIVLIYSGKLFKKREHYTFTDDLGEVDPVSNYVNSWINNIYNAYNAKPILPDVHEENKKEIAEIAENAKEQYVNPRVSKKFSNLEYLNNNAIKTGYEHY